MDEQVNAYNMLVGKTFSELTTEELLIIFAIELWQDGMDSNLVPEIIKIRDSKFVKQQLEHVFNYKDSTVIQDLV